MQTSQQVIDALLHRKKADRYGLLENPWSETMADWVRQGYPTHLVHKRLGQSRWLREDGMWKEIDKEGDYEEPIPAGNYFGFDMTGTAGWFDYQPIRGVNELVEEGDKWEIRRNGGGAALKYWKHKSGTPEPMDFRVSGRAIWERDLIAEYVEAARAEGLRVGFYYSLMDWHHPDGARCLIDEATRRVRAAREEQLGEILIQRGILPMLNYSGSPHALVPARA